MNTIRILPVQPTLNLITSLSSSPMCFLPEGSITHTTVSYTITL